MQFKSVIGQDKIKKKLVESVETGKVSHAQLFTAPEGSGGLAIGIAFAQYLLCESPSENDSCGRCDNCKKMEKMIHPDVHYSFPVIKKDGQKEPPVSNDHINSFRSAIIQNPYINYYDWLQSIKADTKQGNITRNECHQIIKKLSLKAFEGGSKVLLMWLPERLGKEGNALLKLIEEPPAGTYIIMVTEQPDLILNTILSRTQEVRIPKLSIDEIKEALIEKEEIAEEEASSIARMSDGNFSRARMLSKEGETNLSETFQDWMRLCFLRNGLGLLKWVDEMAKKGREEQKGFLRYSLQMIEDIFLYSNGLKEQSSLSESDQDFARRFSGYLGPDTYLKINDSLNEAYYYIERNAHGKIVFFNLSLHINTFFQGQKATTKAN